MAELTDKQGKDIILLYRLLSKATKEAAWKLEFQTEHSKEKTREYNTKETKDGKICSLASIEYSLYATSIAANGDPHLDEMDKAFDDGEIIEVWEIDKAEKRSDGKYKAKFLRDYLTSFSYEPTSEDAHEFTLVFEVSGIPQMC